LNASLDSATASWRTDRYYWTAICA